MNNMPTVTKNLLIINVLCFFGYVVAKRYGIDLNDMLGLHFFLASDFNPAQLITYMFMHANFQHIFFNMFAVWMFGRTLENVWGPKRFLFYYILCGIGAGLIQEAVQYIGSGAIHRVCSEFVTIRWGRYRYGCHFDGRILEYADHCGSIRSRICHLAGFRYAVSQ